MSFGYGVGDVIAVSGLARTIWGRFRDSSGQFHAIQTEVADLCIVLDDIATNFSGLHGTNKQIGDLSQLIRGCREVLTDCEDLLRKNKALSNDPSGLGARGEKAWRKLRWDAASVNGLRDRMVSNATYLNAFNTGLASQASRATNDKIDTVAEDVQRLKLSQNRQERKRVLEWLSSFDFASMQSELSARRQAGTGSWLLNSQEFRDWASEGRKTLVCQGIPGAGKTMLASLVINHLQQSPSGEPTAVAYVYCDYRRQNEQTAINLVASVAKQLLQYQDSIPEDTMKIHQSHSKGTRPSLKEVLKIATSSMKAVPRVYIVVDALDELGNAGLVRRIFTRSLRQLQDRSHFSLMITSRYIPSLVQEFNEPISMDIKANPADIRRYVRAHVMDLPNCVKRNTELQKLIADAIVGAVEGMFLLARLYVDSLRDRTSTNAIKKALRDIPKGSDSLDLAYDGAMQRIEDQMQGFRDSAMRLLGWLTYSERLMTVREVQHALAIELGASKFDEDNLGDVDEIISFCAGLVNVDGETQILRLVHYTTQEYFRRNCDKLPNAQLDIAVGCLTYLLYEDFGDGPGSWNVCDIDEDQGHDTENMRRGEDHTAKQGETHEEQEEEVQGEDHALDHGTANGQGTREKRKEGHDFNKSRDYKKITIQASRQARVEKYPFHEYAARYWAAHAFPRKESIVGELMKSFLDDDGKVSNASQAVYELYGTAALFPGFDQTAPSGQIAKGHAVAYLCSIKATVGLDQEQQYDGTSIFEIWDLRHARRDGADRDDTSDGND